ncbi:MAG: FAD-binding oxidoreductase [Hyphomicrobiales bacterium]|nr:FAD-binding oxidoreductase [Hyphomicrobiales bacterium]
MTDLASRLEGVVGSKGIRRDGEVDLLDPGWHPDNLRARLLVAPASTEEVAEVVRIVAEAGASLVPQGGRTGLVGGARTREDEVVLSTHRLDRILRLDPIERVAVVEAGVTLEALQRAAAEHGLEPGIDLAARGTATIGGMVSTNAGGILAFRNGVMRHRVLGLEAILPDGSRLGDLTRIVKNTTGYDVKQLLIGAEGTLGCVTRIAVRLDPTPRARVTALYGLPSTAAALDLLRRAFGDGRLDLRAAEVMWAEFARATAAANGIADPAIDLSHPVHLLLEAGGAEEAPLQAAFEDLYTGHLEEGLEVGGVIAHSERQRDDIWRLREDTGAIYRLYPAAPSYDVSVPATEIEDWLARFAEDLEGHDPGLGFYAFGHLGDGNLHVILKRAGPLAEAEEAAIDDLVYRDLGRLGGAFSAEHGIGSKRRAAFAVHADPGKAAMVRLLKASLDPDGVMNPGKIV